MMICESSNEQRRIESTSCPKLQKVGMVVRCVQIEGDVSEEYRTRGIGVGDGLK